MKTACDEPFTIVRTSCLVDSWLKVLSQALQSILQNQLCSSPKMIYVVVYPTLVYQNLLRQRVLITTGLHSWDAQAMLSRLTNCLLRTKRVIDKQGSQTLTIVRNEYDASLSY